MENFSFTIIKHHHVALMTPKFAKSSAGIIFEKLKNKIHTFSFSISGI